MEAGYERRVRGREKKCRRRWRIRVVTVRGESGVGGEPICPGLKEGGG